MRERELGGAAVALDVPHDEQAQRDARAVLEVLVPGAVLLDGALEDLGVRPDRIGPIPPKRSRRDQPSRRWAWFLFQRSRRSLLRGRHSPLRQTMTDRSLLVTGASLGRASPQILERALGQARRRFGHAALSQALEVAAPARWPRRSSSSELNNSSSDTLSTTVPMALISGVTPRRTEAKM